eukprot:TRINITY_DN4790_c0_g1_i1.p1 TRINITY_DN4790_c0_g1~~TRINITY_DN4790_c0_g1_i1.p1  ORF type:complete len:176 (+),score=37.94 TRINITY_DN4790_c0_g1_i1:43-570(+)
MSDSNYLLLRQRLERLDTLVQNDGLHGLQSNLQRWNHLTDAVAEIYQFIQLYDRVAKAHPSIVGKPDSSVLPLSSRKLYLGLAFESITKINQCLGLLAEYAPILNNPCFEALCSKQDQVEKSAASLASLSAKVEEQNAQLKNLLATYQEITSYASNMFVEYEAMLTQIEKEIGAH